MVEDWNTEWVNTCQAFEKLEQERLSFFKSNLSDCANLMIGCHEAEIQVTHTHTHTLKYFFLTFSL